MEQKLKGRIKIKNPSGLLRSFLDEQEIMWYQSGDEISFPINKGFNIADIFMLGYKYCNYKNKHQHQ